MIFLVLAVASLLASAATAASPCDVRVGFDGVYRTGSWTPLSITFPAGDPTPEEVCAWVEDPDGQYLRSPAAAVEADADGTQTARVLVRFGRPSARVLIEDLATRGAAPAVTAVDRNLLTPVALPPPIPATEIVMLVLGDLPAAERASRLMARDDGTRPRVVGIDPAEVVGAASSRVARSANLGRTARDFDGADAIVVCGRAVLTADPAVLRGLDGWVRQGGQLIFCAGSTALEIDRGGTVAATWLPGAVAKLVPLRRASAIETFARANRPLDKADVAGLEVPIFKAPQAILGNVEAFEGKGAADLPLAVRRPHGLGTVFWVGVDLDKPPFRNWSGSDSMLVEMLRGRRAAKDAGRSGETSRGTLDLAGQLRQAIDHFPGVAPIPFEVIAGLGILYVVCLYPLDWWLASRLGRATSADRQRGRWLGWLSLPLLVAAASWLAWSAGQRWKGTSWQTSAAQVIDLDVASGLVRVTAFAGIWSPVNAALDLTVRSDLATSSATSSAISWFAACGRGIGGTDAAAPHPSLAAGDYAARADAQTDGESINAAAALIGVPIAASSSRLFEAEVTGRLATAVVESTLAREGQGTLKGAVTSRLAVALEECVLAHGGWLYEVGSLAPGQTFEPGMGRGPRSLAGAITRRTANTDRDIAARWDIGDRDPLRILEVAGFHAAAGGSSYTSLESGRLARLDLSPLLPLDRAVLVGRGPAAIVWKVQPQLVGDSSGSTDMPDMPDMPDNACLWRIVIPLVPPVVSQPVSQTLLSPIK